MKIDGYLTDQAALGEIGARLARERLNRNMTQRALGDSAGVGRPTIQRIEAGEPVVLTSIIRVLRALDLLENLNVLVPEPSIAPMDLLKLQGKARQRARARPSEQRARELRPWQWGVE